MVKSYVKYWPAVAAAIAVLASFVTAAGATAPVMPTQPGSDRRLAAQLPIVDRAIDILQRAHEDYHGDRTRAVDDLKVAESDLRAALKSDNESEPTALPIPYTPPENPGGMTSGTQTQSDEMLADARTLLDHVIDDLQRDNHDYGGYRVKAIADVQRSRDQLDDALQASDSNIVATSGLLTQAVAVLQQAKQDYGGHRVLAGEAIDRAHADLIAAIKADHLAENGLEQRIATEWANPTGHPQETQLASDERLRDARAIVGSAIDNLQHDSHDYAGYRAKAVTELQTATHEIDLALSRT